MSDELPGDARAAWRDQPTGDLVWAREQVAARATRIGLRAAAARATTLLVALGCVAWAIYLALERPASPLRAFTVVPWLLIAVAAAAHWWERRKPAPGVSSGTLAFMRAELARDVHDCRRLAGWRGFAALLGVMWLVIGTRIAADGAAYAFAARGLAAGLALAILAPLVASALIHLAWRWQLRRTAAAKQLELDYLDVFERSGAR
jgi:multisubunit Na+/H+ antiporter MnhG subunit